MRVDVRLISGSPPICCPTAGFITASEVLLTPPPVLVSKTRLSPKDVSQLLLELSQLLSDTPLARTATVMELAGPRRVIAERTDSSTTEAAVDLLRERRNFTVGDAAIDTLLGDGIQLGSITEIAGQS